MVICKDKDCKKNATFGIKGKGAVACKKHKTDEMVDVVSQRCIDCKDKQPTYNYDGEKHKYCKDCKKDGMIDVKNKKCIKCKKKQCCYNYKHATVADYCIDCKTDDMIDVKNKKCIECKKSQPSFNFEGEPPQYCGKCKKEGMINLVEKRICIKCNKTQASFGFPGEDRTHCASCKEEGMVDLSKIKCVKCNLITPHFGYENEKPQCCFNCKEEDMKNVTSKRCKTDLCETLISNPLYEGHCAYCFSNLFPNSKVVKNFRTKERFVVDYIKKMFPDHMWLFDRIIKEGISRRRPDIYLDLGSYIIIIEIDEFQHRRYDKSCDNERLMELSLDAKHKPIIFIRFNPDRYVNKNREVIKSCFSINKETGLTKINDKNMWEERLSKLTERINYWMENKTEKTIEIDHLFYDEKYVN